MDDSQQRSPFTPLLIGLLVLGGYFLFERTFGAKTPPPPSPAAIAAQRNASALDDRARTARQRAQHLFDLHTPSFDATLTDRNASLTRLVLLGEKFEDSGTKRPHAIVTTDREEYLPLALELRGVNIPANATWRGEQLSETAARFTWEGNGFRVTRKIEAVGGAYQLWSTVRVENLDSAPHPVRVVDTLHHYVRRSQEGGGFLASQPREVSRGVCTADSLRTGFLSFLNRGPEKIREPRDNLTAGRALGPNVHFVGIENLYFTTAIAMEDGRADRCALTTRDLPRPGDSADGTLFAAKLHHRRQVVAPHASVLFRSVAYFGPKDLASLTAAGHHFSEIVDLGFFSVIARRLIDLLRFIQTFVGNWGLAIILLTFLVKLVLYPLTAKSFQSMAKMKVLKPEMDRINEVYADDREKKGQAIMALYQKHKINPLAGCLPSLLQMPIWFALYQSLSTNIELYHAPFFGYWKDLSSPDAFYVLPLILGALMWVQQKITPSTMDPVQAKMMLWMMPTMMTAFMLFLPAGLCLYMVTNSTLGIAQQRYIQWRLDRQPVAAITETADPTGGAASAPSSNDEQKSGRDKKGTRRGRS